MVKSAEQQIFEAYQALSEQVRQLGSIVQNPVEGPVPSEDLVEFVDQSADASDKLLELQADVVNLFLSKGGEL